MRVYFVSKIPAILKLNGLYIGTIDGFERHIELDPDDGVFAEIVPDGNLQTLNFFLDKKFFSAPPEHVDLYVLGDDRLIYIREYSAKDLKLSVIYQTRFNGNLITVFSQGNCYLSAEGDEYSLTPLPFGFSFSYAEICNLGGREALCIYGKRELLIVSERGKLIFMNRVESALFKDNLTVCAPFETCTAAKAECSYAYDGESLKLISSRTIETRPPERDILHFAFFECVLTRGDYTKYLDESLAPKASALTKYLGEYVSVTVPTEKFYSLHGDIAAAGLVYPKSKNVFEVRYFAAEIENDKITNIYPIE